MPGEGFGDDFLQHYSEHQLLNDDNEAEFLLDEAYEAMGGTCYQRSGGSGGPPLLEEPVPSQLEKEESSWRSIEYTFSPVYTPPQSSEAGISPVSAMSLEVEDGVDVKACMEGNTLSFEMAVKTQQPVWMAVGFREDADCVMTPRGGADGQVVWVQPEASGEISVKFGMLPGAIRGFSPTVSQEFLASLQQLEATPDMGEGSVSFRDGKMTVTFKRSYTAAVPEEFHLNFAHGGGADIGYHPSRGCFKLEGLPSCGEEARIDAGCPVCQEGCAEQVAAFATDGASVESSALAVVHSTTGKLLVSMAFAAGIGILLIAAAL